MGTSILVVEDENIVAKDIVNRLRNLGYLVAGTAASGEDAIRITQRERPDLVLMDIMLKGEMDGVEAAAIINGQFDTPVIYLTAYADDKTLQRAKRTDAFGYLLKPFEERELHITIEMALFKHQMEHRLRESEEWLSAVLQSIGDAVIATDARGTIKFMNIVAENLTGWSRHEAVSKPLTDVFRVIDEKNRTPLPNLIEATMRPGQPTRLVMRSLLVARDGREFPIDDSASPIRNAAGEPTGVVVVFHDVTDRRRAEEALRQSQSQLAGIVGSAMDAIVTIDTDQHILLFNSAAEKMFGCSVHDAVGKPLSAFIPERFHEIHEKHVDEFGRTNVTRRMMAHYNIVFGRRADGEEFPIEASISQIDVGGKRFYTVILRDVTERNKLEDQLRQAQKMESIGALASGIAHDFNNVLNNILGFASQLKKHILDATKVKKYVDTIELSAQRGAELASQLLSFARTSRRSATTVDIHRLVSEVIAAFAEATHAQIVMEEKIQPDLWQVVGDHGDLYQVLLNLAVNARDAMAASEAHGGTLTISARNVVIGKDVGAQLFALRGNQCVELSVSDTGTGIPEDIRTKIFDPFFTTKERGKGTGLGLSIVYNIVRAHNGTIALDSEINKGTTFRIYLPTVTESPAVEARPKANRCVLLVDDEPAMQELGKEVLEDDGFEVLIATNGPEAIDLYRHRQKDIDVVILDLVMPGMDGGQVYTHLKTMNPNVKAFFCTGYISNQVIASLLSDGNLRAISKPFRPDEFLRTVREVMES